MAMGSGLLALAMVAADGPVCPPVEATTYHVRVLTLDGLDWRTSSYARLQPVARQGSSTIWTADRALAASLVDRAKASSPCHTIMAVGEAVMTKAEAVNYVAAMERVADGPINQSSAIAFMPRPEQVEERFSIRVEGRKLDQGVLTRIAMEESHVDVIHGVPQSETLVPPAAKSSKTRTEQTTATLEVIRASTSNIPEATSITSSVQIPEVTRASVAGEWLIPNDGVLLVSLGVKTAADDKGMAVVRERVAVVEACPATGIGPNGLITPAQAEPFQHTKLGHPVVPGRSMPEAIDPQGNVVDLPPLPEAVASTDLDRIKPEPFQPSPQGPIRSAPSTDPSLARTSYDAAPPAPKVPTVYLDVAGHVVEFADVIVALGKAGMKVDSAGGAKVLTDKSEVHIEFDKNLPIARSSSSNAPCEKCDDDATVCPANARSMKTGQVAGGIKLVPDPSPAGLSNQDALTDFAAFLASAEDRGEALKLLGQTKTTIVHLGENVSLELKATVVPTSPENARSADKKDEAPAKR
jgi:hypothetical protein